MMTTGLISKIRGLKTNAKQQPIPQTDSKHSRRQSLDTNNYRQYVLKDVSNSRCVENTPSKQSPRKSPRKRIFSEKKLP